MIKLSAASKILLYFLLIITVFLVNSIKVDLLLLVLALIFASRVKISTLKRGIIPITLFLIFTFSSNIFFQTGRVVYEVFGIIITEEGLKNGCHLTLRLLILILGAKILTATTTAEDLVGGMMSLLGPFGKWRPIKEFVSTMSLTLRFLPIIYDEAQRLYKGAFKNSTEATFLDKIRLSASLLTPLFERSMKRVSDLQKPDML